VTSRPSGKIAADANVLLSAAVNGAARRVFRSDTLSVVTTDVTLAETKERLPILAAKYRLTPPAVSAQLAALPVEVVPEARYRSHLPEAHRYLGTRDPSDVPLAALALKLEIPIWSNDRDFEELPLIVYPTARLLKILGL
jgi:predicted nucleic acid-binding protein